MEESGADECSSVTILDVLGVEPCARAILDLVPIADLAHSERVSRWWQHVVCKYLPTCRTLSYEGFRYPHDNLRNAPLTKDHRTITIHNHNHSLPLVLKTLDKWGPYIMKVTTDLGDDTKFDIHHSFALDSLILRCCTMSSYLDIIVSKCPKLKQITIVRNFNDRQRSLVLNPIKNLKEMKHVVLENIYRLSNNSDLVLSEIFQDMNCETITVKCIEDLTGSFLTYLKSSSLKSLSLTRCRSLRGSDLLSAVDNIHNLTSLELDEGENESTLSDVHLLISKMPLLEELTLRFVSSDRPINEEWNKAFSRLGNLKRLYMWGTFGRVNDTFLEVLASGCKKLEYLKIERFDESVTARGVTALCSRSPSARTTLHFPLEDVHDFVYESLFLSDFIHVPLYVELAALGCVELTLEWFVAACRDPRGRELPLNTSRGFQAEDPQKELKLIIF